MNPNVVTANDFFHIEPVAPNVQSSAVNPVAVA
jgi:hypothetical protein